jgi:hypothetical protein
LIDATATDDRAINLEHPGDLGNVTLSGRCHLSPAGRRQARCRGGAGAWGAGALPAGPPLPPAPPARLIKASREAKQKPRRVSGGAFPCSGNAALKVMPGRAIPPPGGSISAPARCRRWDRPA